MDDWADRIHPDDRAGFRARLEAGEADGDQVCSMEYRIRDHQDRYRRMLARWSVVRQYGLLTRCVGVQIDLERGWAAAR